MELNQAPPTPPLAYDDVIKELESRPVFPDRTPNLDVMRQALDRLQLSINPTKVILVGGTNGKGSVAATLHHLLLQTGLNAGLYTSPHLVDTTERIRLNERDITREEFVKVFAKVNALTFDLRPSHFETLTLMAAWAFFSGELGAFDWVILEVGLGGTWDATNAIPHATNVLSSIGFDHMDLLGDTLPEIARNKFGIISNGGRVYHADFPEDLMRLVAETEEEKKCRFIPAAGFTYKVEASRPGMTPKFTIKTQWGQAELALPGRRGAENTALALTVFEGLGYSTRHYIDQLRFVNWPGRMERVADPKCPCAVYLSGDHNADGMRSLMELLPSYGRDHLYVLVGVGQAKDMDGILRPLFDLPNTTIALTQTPFRGRPLGDYGSWLDRAQFAHPDPLEAYGALRALAKKRDLLLVTGSLYLVGEIRKWLGGTKKTR